MNLRDYSSQLLQLNLEITSFDGYIRDPVFIPWVERFNALVSGFNHEFNRSFPEYPIQDARFTLSGKTIKSTAVTALKLSVANLKKEVDSLIQEEKSNASHFRCFKIGHKCPHEIDTRKYLFFIGMPFDSQYIDSYQFGIKAMLDQHGIETAKRVFKADEKFSTVDILCKICKAIQESQYVIINISGQNPNVMFELGLAYGLNKTVFLIKDARSTEISDLKGLEYTQYSNAGDLASKLQTRFHELGII